MKIQIFILFGLLSAALALPMVDPALKKALIFGRTNIMITLANTTNSILAPLQAQQFATREDRLNAVASALTAHAHLTQTAVLNLLATFTSINITSYWISNQIFVRGANTLLVRALSALTEVGKIEPEFFIQLYSSRPSFHAAISPRQSGTNTYGVTKIQAPDVWKLGYKGQGVLVANIDTGVLLSHVSLNSRFVGQYGWYDPSGKTKEPNDQNGHGTHTMGTIAGSGGIGVAPEANWMACKGCGTSSCSSNDLTACGQWIQCPTLTDGSSSKDCARAPWVVSNSWGGGQGSNWYNSIVNAWKTAWIIPVFSIGNSGPNCGSANSPGDQPNLIAVGATDSSDKLASYSSVGPVVSSGSNANAVKPDIAAPGSSVVSASYKGNNDYATMSGTSMACPHVAGVVALMQSKNPNLTYDDIYKYLTGTAVRTGLSGGNGKNCGGKTDTQWPNNSFGYGRVNALNAVKAF